MSGINEGLLSIVTGVILVITRMLLVLTLGMWTASLVSVAIMGTFIKGQSALTQGLGGS